MKKNKEITEYDNNDTTTYINKNEPKKLKDIGITLPKWNNWGQPLKMDNTDSISTFINNLNPEV